MIVKKVFMIFRSLSQQIFSEFFFFCRIIPSMGWVVLYDLNVTKLFNKVKSHHFTWKASYYMLIYLFGLFVYRCL